MKALHFWLLSIVAGALYGFIANQPLERWLAMPYYVGVKV